MVMDNRIPDDAWDSGGTQTYTTEETTGTKTEPVRPWWKSARAVTAGTLLLLLVEVFGIRMIYRAGQISRNATIEDLREEIHMLRSQSRFDPAVIEMADKLRSDNADTSRPRPTER